ncbi:HugZ family protein [Pseudoalteromonas sp.]|uniref:HugZ family pyridoxamine 5'-phosphate oxidase n=1 Tax=Pseudoalteromonas sp. TaxID=53249 RepID=UPI00260A44BE|nr:pyridoxamine 5'-phosphate oxidase family protein [Pseudoalteromonas sp.]MCP4588136.1 HugZ family protein [Pseudoalteromonas sp.]
MSEKDIDYAELSTNCRALQEGKRTLLLSTLSESGFPEISYAPYCRSEPGEFYIFISELAAHTQNLIHNPKASVMFVADESDTQNQFARERLIYQCDVSEIDQEAESYSELLNKLQDKFGNIVGMLRSLPDFHLFQLKPFQGSYVVGFGRAYEINPITNELEHISEAKLKGEGEAG